MRQGALLAILVGSVHVAATTQANAWQRWGGVPEQRSPRHQVEERQDDGAVRFADPTPIASATAPASPFSDAGPASTAIKTAFSAGVPLTAVPATTAGPTSFEIHSFSSTILKVTTTLVNGEVCVVSELGQYEFITLYDVVTLFVTASNSTSTASQLYPNYNGTSSYGVGPTVSSLAEATTTSSFSHVAPSINGTHYSHSTEASSAALLSSSAAIFANSTLSAAPTPVSEVSSSLVLTTKSSLTAPALSSTGIFASSTASTAATSVLELSSSLISSSSALVLSTTGIFGNSTTSAFATSISLGGSASSIFANPTAESTTVPESSTSSSFAVLAPSISDVSASSTTSSEPTTIPELSTSSSEVMSTTFASPPRPTSQNITRSRAGSVLPAASSTSTYTFTTLTRPFPSQNDPTTAYLTTLSPPKTSALTTTRLSYSSAALVIETTLTATITGPVVSAATSRSVSITATVTGSGWHHHHGHHGHGNAPQPIGTPSPGKAFCGVHGLPLGVDYMGTWSQNDHNVPITLEGCYQFCKFSLIHGKGCQSYYFHEREGLEGSSACDIYGGPVYAVLKAMDENVQGVWYDARCPDPVASG